MVQEQGRCIEDIHVFVRWVARQVKNEKHRSSNGQSVQTSAFAASSVYDKTDMARILPSSGSVLNLTLGDSEDDTLGVVWTPDPVSRVPLRRAITTSIPGIPEPDKRGGYMRTDKIMTLSSSGPPGSSDVLRSIATVASSARTSLLSNKRSNLLGDLLFPEGLAGAMGAKTVGQPLNQNYQANRMGTAGYFGHFGLANKQYIWD